MNNRDSPPQIGGLDRKTLEPMPHSYIQAAHKTQNPTAGQCPGCGRGGWVKLVQARRAKAKTFWCLSPLNKMFEKEVLWLAIMADPPLGFKRSLPTPTPFGRIHFPAATDSSQVFGRGESVVLGGMA